jgi:hypothetical protein
MSYLNHKYKLNPSITADQLQSFFSMVVSGMTGHRRFELTGSDINQFGPMVEFKPRIVAIYWIYGQSC